MMADEFDQDAQQLGFLIFTVYELISQVCGLLPVPITLPGFEDDTLKSATMIEAVARITTVIEDEPISEETLAGLWSGCLHWLSAAHLLGLYMETGQQIIGTEARLNIVTAHDSLHLVEHMLQGE